MLLVTLRLLALLVCLVSTGAAVLLPEHPWLQLLASAVCTLFGWIFGLPPGALLALQLARLRPQRLAEVVTEAAASMPPPDREQVMQSLRPPPPPSIAPIVFEGDEENGPPA